MRPPFQERFQVYVLGPDQDPRLALIAPGQVVSRIQLRMDTDAPFKLRARALRQQYTAIGESTFNLGTQDALQFLATKWTGPREDYRQSDYVLESLQAPYFGGNGSPTKVSPEITYPPGGTLTLDLVNTGVNPIVNLVFYWIGVNLYPWGARPAPTYPADFRGSNFAQPFIIDNLVFGAPPRLNQPFTCHTDGDFVVRAGLAAQICTLGLGEGAPQPGQLFPASEMFVKLKDWDGTAYMNDWVDINILFGMSGFISSIPVGPVPTFIPPYGTGAGLPGLIYPEIYLPMNHQLLIDLDNRQLAGPGPGIVGVTTTALLINFIGAKIFKGAR